MPENMVIGWPRWTADFTFASNGGSSFNASYPVTNLSALPLTQLARTATAATANTKWQATCATSRLVRALAFVGHNFSLDARYRIRLYSNTALTTLLYDTGWDDVWPVVFPLGSVPFEDEHFWTGKYVARDIAGYVLTRPVWLPAAYICQGILIEVDDTGNSAGYVECGLFEIAQGWQVGVNLAYGTEYGFDAHTAVQAAPGGAKYFDRLDKPRLLSGTINYMDRDEVLAQGFEHLRQADLDTPFLVLQDPDDETHMLRTAFLARNRQLPLLAYAAYGRDRLPFAFEEVIV